MSTAIVPVSSIIAPAVATPTTKAIDPTEARRQRGLAIAAVTRIERKQSGLWTVPAQSGTGRYWVRIDGAEPACSCPDFEERGQPCKHIFAVQFVIQRETNPDGTETVTETLTVAKKTTAPRPTYKQNWSAYNKAQTTEKAQFQILLHDLCRCVPEPERKPGPGRKPVPLADVIFAAVFKVYSTFSGRRFQTDLDAAHERGYLSRPVRYNTVFDHFEDAALAPILRSLITESAKPLRSIEVDFAVDSSGFATSRFARWFDEKYGVVKKEYDWVKCHLMTGVTTNIVTAVVIDGHNSGDCPQFAPLVRATAKNFRINEVSADGAYLSYENMDLVGTLGGTPFIAFKSNTTAAEGGLFATMFHYYNLRRDEFLSHYHKRSNVETTFSMIKGKFGDHLRSKTDAAMINEALAKVLCHNLCCLIQSHYELGIAPVFWGKEAAEVEPFDVEPIDEPTETPIDAYDWL